MPLSLQDYRPGCAFRGEGVSGLTREERPAPGGQIVALPRVQSSLAELGGWK
jgi:hypothetical protein